MGLFKSKSTTVAHGVTVNVEVLPGKSEKPQPSEPELIPFDVDAYNTMTANEEAAKYARYDAARGCVKCGAAGKTFPHKSVYKNIYLVYPHKTERENERRWDAFFRAQDDWYTSMWGGPRERYVRGPGYIARTCVRCGYEWKELACDEPTEKKP